MTAADHEGPFPPSRGWPDQPDVPLTTDEHLAEAAHHLRMLTALPGERLGESAGRHVICAQRHLAAARAGCGDGQEALHWVPFIAGIVSTAALVAVAGWLAVTARPVWLQMLLAGLALVIAFFGIGGSVTALIRQPARQPR